MAEGSTRREWVYRHPLFVRLTHWINVVCVFFLLGSGLQIFNAHSALYFGHKSDAEKSVLSMRAARDGTRVVGITTVAGLSFETTGVLGLSTDETGRLVPRGFPSWLTIPSYQDLATGRLWHFLFAWIFVINGLIYLLLSLGSGHAKRDLLPARGQLGSIGRTIGDHLRLRFARGAEARHYNVLQKLTYLGVVFVVLPVLAVAGLAMSPALNAAYPWLPELFGGRQSARTFHFIAASLLTLFIFVHVAMVLVSGVWNNLRSMVTGRYAIKVEETRP